jgi:hypothetical protein
MPPIANGPFVKVTMLTGIGFFGRCLSILVTTEVDVVF